MSNAAGAWTGRGAAVPTRIVLLRHGQSPLSVERRYSGRGNPSLTELGREQAAAAAAAVAEQHPEAAAIVSSPLARARSTAEAAGTALGLPVQVDDGFVETDFGTWEGLTFREAAEQDPQEHRSWLSDPSVAPPGGESFDDVEARVTVALDGVLERFAGSTVVVVSHVTPIKMVLKRALDCGPSLLFRLHLDLACISVVDFWSDGGASVRLVGASRW